MDSFDLFPGMDLGARVASGAGCAAPIGRRDTGRRRRPVRVRPRHPSTVTVLAELRGLLERQHAELMGEVHRLRQQRRNEHETLPAVLKRVSEIERHLRFDRGPGRAADVEAASDGSMSMDDSEKPTTNIVELPLSDERISDVLRAALRRDEPGAALKAFEHAVSMSCRRGDHDLARAFARLAGQQDILDELDRLVSERGGLITPLAALHKFHNQKLTEVMRAVGLDPEQ